MLSYLYNGFFDEKKEKQQQQPLPLLGLNPWPLTSAGSHHYATTTSQSSKSIFGL